MGGAARSGGGRVGEEGRARGRQRAAGLARSALRAMSHGLFSS